MPNHVTNELTFCTKDHRLLPPEEFKFMLMVMQGDDPDRCYGSIDFNVFIPMPDGYADDDRWYMWSINHWGTKWNAYDCACDTCDEAANRIYFLTAWTRPRPVIEAISRRFRDVYVCHRWADEDLGNNVGKALYFNGELIESDIPDEGSRRAYDMAADIMDIDLADYDLVLGEDGEYHSIYDN